MEEKQTDINIDDFLDFEESFSEPSVPSRPVKPVPPVAPVPPDNLPSKIEEFTPFEKFVFEYPGKLTTVVRLKKAKGKTVQDCDIYIGRAMNMGGWKLPKSKWSNPFKVKDHSSPKVACELYREYILKSPLMKDLEELRGKTLGCWCKGKHECHGDVLVELLK